MFKEIAGIKDVLNSEGPILRLVQKMDNDGVEHDLFLEAKYDEGQKKIYTKINIETLKLYFNSRLRLFELFLLHSDEPYFLYSDNTYSQSPLGDSLRFNIMCDLACGKFFFSDISEGMRGDAREILRIASLYYN
jgi:hypothetical protein